MQYENVIYKLSNYATDSLQDILTKYGRVGFKLVNVTMAQNSHGIDIMYLFFTREVNE